MKTEIITLIIGTFLGAILTFLITRIEKKLDFAKEQKKAIMCLKIKISRIDKFLYGLSNTESKFGNIIPDQNLPELDLAVQADQFMYYNEILAGKIYELAKCIEGANRRRQIAYELLGDQKNPKFISSADMYSYELKESKKILSEIKNFIFQKDKE